jgi:hypothetical protein
MRCHACGDDAIGVCRFCGRAVCDDHHRTMPYIMTVYRGEDEIPKAVVVADALFCGTCRPQPEPIPMPELY